jgi:phosphate/phosphite/phosphonate ABC transporter binding protein
VSRLFPFLAAALLACSSREAPRGSAPPPAPRPEKALLFGFSPAHGAAEAAVWGARLATYLSARTGLRSRPFVASSYGALVEGLRQGRVDVGWLPPLVYVTAARGADIAPLVKFVRHGRGDYHAAFIVRAASPVRDLRELQGKRIAWSDPRSSAGYLFPRTHLVEQGLEPDRFFAHQVFLGSHRRVVEAVLDGRADVGVTFFSPGPRGAVVMSAWHQYVPARAKEIRVLASVGPIPSDVISARRALGPEIHARFREAFVGMHEHPVGRELLQAIFNADRALPSSPGDYASLEEMARRSKIR